LNAEYRFLLACCARRLGGSVSLPVGPSGDWERVLAIARTNHLSGLLFRELRESGGALDIPAPVMETLKQHYQRNLVRVTRAENEAVGVVRRLQEAGVEAVLLRGLGLGHQVYGDTAVRPFTDMDLLIRRDRLSAAKTCLEAEGLLPPSSALPSRYFERHHLHLEYGRPGGLAFELHWALDHKYLPFTIDYDAMLGEAVELTLAGGRMSVPCPEHDIICNAIHLAKHATFLVFDRDPDAAAQRLVAEGHLLHVCDILGRSVHRDGRPDWDRVGRLCSEWNVAREVGAFCRRRLISSATRCRPKPLRRSFLAGRRELIG